MSATVFRHIHRVTYAECTMGNHVYYARYLNWIEAARAELFRHLGTTFRQWQELGAIFPVVECHLRYKAPARYDDLLTIEVWPAELEGARLNFGHQVANQAGRVLLEAETSHVCTDLHERPRRLPKELVQSLKPWLRTQATAP